MNGPDPAAAGRPLEGSCPLLPRHIAAQDHASGAPGRLVKTGSLQYEFALPLGGRSQILPIADRVTTDLRTLEDGTGRNRCRIDDPGLRNNFLKEFPTPLGERLGPEIVESMMMKQRERKFLLLETA